MWPEAPVRVSLTQRGKKKNLYATSVFGWENRRVGKALGGLETAPTAGAWVTGRGCAQTRVHLRTHLRARHRLRCRGARAFSGFRWRWLSSGPAENRNRVETVSAHALKSYKATLGEKKKNPRGSEGFLWRWSFLLPQQIIMIIVVRFPRVSGAPCFCTWCTPASALFEGRRWGRCYEYGLAQTEKRRCQAGTSRVIGRTFPSFLVRLLFSWCWEKEVRNIPRTEANFQIKWKTIQFSHLGSKWVLRVLSWLPPGHAIMFLLSLLRGQQQLCQPRSQ